MRHGRIVYCVVIAALIMPAIQSGKATAGPAINGGCAREVVGNIASDLELTGDDALRAEKLTSSLENDAGFLALVPQRSGGFMLISEPDFVDGLQKSVADPSVSVVPSCIASGTVAAAKAAASRLSYDKGEFSGVHYNPYTDEIVVLSSNVQRLREAVSSDAVAAKLATDSDLSFVAQSSADASRLGRTADTAPHWAGANIIVGGAGCSSGFYVSSGFGPFMLTAGHCGAVGSSVTNGTGSSSFGTIAARAFPDPDIEIMNGATYSGRVYSANDNTSNKAVFGSSNPSLNVTYCQYGAQSRRVCGAYSNLSAQFCDVSGCTNNLAFTTQSGAIPGDSGGAVGIELSNGKIGARGTVVAGGAAQRYDQKWGTIAATFGLTIVNG